MALASKPEYVANVLSCNFLQNHLLCVLITVYLKTKITWKQSKLCPRKPHDCKVWVAAVAGAVGR